jgi:hypothetical protein
MRRFGRAHADAITASPWARLRATAGAYDDRTHRLTPTAPNPPSSASPINPAVGVGTVAGPLITDHSSNPESAT